MVEENKNKKKVSTPHQFLSGAESIIKGLIQRTFRFFVFSFSSKPNWYGARKKRYLSVLLFLVLAIVIFNFSCGISHAGLFTQSTDKIIRGGVGFATIAAAPMFLAFNLLLYVVYVFAGILLIVAGILMDWAINPTNFLMVMNMQSIANGWTIVRDFLNLLFILVLLFSAFCTIFQVEKYHLKKILLTLVLMALLVNFSFPISRFIIDSANVTMYFIINRAFPDLSNTSGISTAIVQFSKIVYAVAPSTGLFGYKLLGYTFTVKMVAAIVFLFILGATLLIIAILLIIRIIVLAILVIFSPVGFVGMILPQFKRFSDMWWDALFKQSFFGVIMAFMLYLALKMMEDMQTSNGVMDSIKLFVQANFSNDNYSTLIVTGVQMAIPITLLWIGLISAQKMGAVGAQWAQKKVMGGMSAVTGLSWLKRTKDAYTARRKEAQATSASNRLGRWLGSKQDQALSGVKIPGMQKTAAYAGLRYQQDQIRKTEEAAKLRDTKNASESALKGLSLSGDKFEKAAAILELAARERATGGQLDSIRQIFGSDGQVTKQIEAKMKTYAPDAVFADQMVNGQRTGFSAQAEDNLREFVRSNQFDAKKLGVGALGNVGLMHTLFQERAIDNKKLEEIRGKSDVHGATIARTIAAVANTQGPQGNYIYADSNDDIHRNIQMAHYAQRGAQSYAAMSNPEMESAIYNRLDKDTFKRTTAETVRMDSGRMASYMKPNVYKSAVANMLNDDAQRELNSAMQNIPENINPVTREERNAQSIRRVAINDHDIKHIHN